MFERFSERARRVVFFARYEASVLRSQSIETEHLLLALLREDHTLKARFSPEAIEQIFEEFRARVPKDTQAVSVSVDMPLSAQCKRLLVLASEESESLKNRSIDSGHLVLGILRMERSVAADILRRNGIEYGEYRELVRSTVDRPIIPMPAVVVLPPDALRLETLVNKAAQHLDSQAELDGEVRLKRAPWTRQEALGHLVDWATCHQQWFARALSEPKVVGTSYPAPEWAGAQEYLQFGWQDLVDLWICINRLLIHVLARIPEAKLETPCRIGIEAAIPLSKLIANYVDHCEDVMAQILVRGWRSNAAAE